jgi:hypothetical protein
MGGRATSDIMPENSPIFERAPKWYDNIIMYKTKPSCLQKTAVIVEAACH